MWLSVLFGVLYCFDLVFVVYGLLLVGGLVISLVGLKLYGYAFFLFVLDRRFCVCLC